MTDRALPILDFNPADRRASDFQPKDIIAAVRRVLAPSVAAFPYVLGIDISHWNTVIDFAAIKAAGFEFVIIKCAERYVEDPKFADFWRRARDAGLIIGVYYFFRDDISGSSQADFCLETIEPLRVAMSGHIMKPRQDIETNNGASITVRRQRITDWDNYIVADFGAAGAYSSKSLWLFLTNNMTLADGDFGAHWTSAALPYWPVGWSPFSQGDLWQFAVYPTYSWAIPVPGITGAVDEIKYYGTIDQLRAEVGLSELSDHDRILRLENMMNTFHPGAIP